MSRWLPCKRRDFIKKLKRLGFTGPYSGTRHQFMIFMENRLAIPSNTEYTVPQLKMLLHEIEQMIHEKIDSARWNSLD